MTNQERAVNISDYPHEAWGVEAQGTGGQWVLLEGGVHGKLQNAETYRRTLITKWGDTIPTRIVKLTINRPGEQVRAARKALEDRND